MLSIIINQINTITESYGIFPVVGILGLIFYAIFRFARNTYRLHYHPLAKFPGPRDAVFSNDWLYKTSMKGNPEVEFEKLHKEYNSHAIRIGPNELHISDPKLYTTIYTPQSQFIKHVDFYNAFGGDNLTVFGTDDPAFHKLLRHKMSPSFSHGSVAKSHKYLVESFIDLAARLTTRGYDRPVDLNYFCRCLPADVICKLAYGQTNVIAAADDDFHTPVLDTFDENAASIWLRAYYPYIRYAQDNLIPFGLGSRLSPAIRRVRAFHILAHSNVRAFREGRSSIPDIKPIISMVADMPDEVVSRNAVVLLAAGSDTTGMTLAYACWQILQNPQLLERLLAEVDPLFDAAAPHMPDMSVLETAPLLSALVKESLRCAMAVPGRLPRIVPENAKTPLVVDGQLVPAGTVVGMSAYTCHTDTEVWGPDAREFNPDRWLGPDSTAKFSDVMTFGKGVRSCLGQPLAMAELAMGLAFFFRTYHMELQRGSDAWETFDRFTYLLTTPFYVKMSLRREVVVAA